MGAAAGGAVPYYERDGVTIYHADCREVLPTLAAGSVDLVLTDPPYNVRDDDWDSFTDGDFVRFTEDWVLACRRVAPLLISFFPDKALPLLARAAAHAGYPFRRSLVWRKPPGSQFAGASLDGFWYDFELIQVYGEPTKRHAVATRFGMLTYKTVTSPLHGCQKPVGLLREVIDAYTEPGALILDPFMGSGSTLRAAKDLGRRAIGVEIEERYCEIAVARLAQGVLPLAGG